MPRPSIPPIAVLPRLRKGTSSLIGRFRKRHPAAGSRPGTLVIPEGAEPPRIREVDYGPAGISERDIASPRETGSPVAPGQKRWIDVQGLGDESLLRELAEVFEIHPLLLEDVVNVPQPPKCEGYDRQYFLATRMFRVLEGNRVESEQVSIILCADAVITIQERAGDVLDPVRRRLREGIGPIRVSGPDYLAYAILDTVVDHYYPVVDLLGRRLEDLEERVVLHGDEATMRRLMGVKSDLLSFRRALRPQRDALQQLMREGSPWIGAGVLPYFRDTLDHCTQALEVIDSDRELVNGLMNTHLSAVANRTNEVMKVLTIMASIFIPLTFLAGIYGMNFEHMPELHTRWAYPVILLLMAATALGMLGYFRWKGWIGSGRRGKRKDDE